MLILQKNLDLNWALLKQKNKDIFVPDFDSSQIATAACSVGWFVSLLVRKEVLLAGLCERKILFWLKIYDRLRQATAKRTGGKDQFYFFSDLYLFFILCVYI